METIETPEFETLSPQPVAPKYRPYPKYRDSGVKWLGRVPEHWEVLPLKRVASMRSGSGITSEAIEDEEAYPVYGGNGLRGYTSNYTHDGLFPLIGRQGALCGNVNYANGKFWASEHAVVVQPCSGIEVKWLGELLRSMNLNQYSVAAAQPGLAIDKVQELRIPVPPQLEQRLIASFLDRKTGAIDEVIRMKERQIELLREKRQATITRAVTRGLDRDVKMKDSGVEWLGEVPEHWSAIPIRYVARLESGHTPSRKDEAYWVDCTVPWFTLADVWQLRDGTRKIVTETKEKVSELGLANSSARVLPAGTVVVSRTASVGYSGIMAVPMATTQDFANWVCGTQLLPDFLLYIFRGMKEEFQRLMTGSTHQTIYMPDIARFRMALPPLEEQRTIAAFIDYKTAAIDEVIHLIQCQIDTMQQRRQSVIFCAVTGKIDAHIDTKSTNA